MTRLRTEDISDISARLKEYDGELVRKTGRTLRGIACFALSIDEEIHYRANSVLVAVVPVRSGMGVITGFSSVVRDIVGHVGFPAFVTEASDVAGVAEAVERGAEVVMMADDFRFVALCLKTGGIVDNSEATAKGFVAGLDLIAGGIEKQKVLIIGCGPVGRGAVWAALQRGAFVSVYDIDVQRSEKLAREINDLSGETVTVENAIAGKEGEGGAYNLIVEATNAADVIHEGNITAGTVIAAPGMPLGLTPGAVGKAADRLLHDPLQLGVAVMAMEAVVSPPRARRPRKLRQKGSNHEG